MVEVFERVQMCWSFSVCTLCYSHWDLGFDDRLNGRYFYLIVLKSGQKMNFFSGRMFHPHQCTFLPPDIPIWNLRNLSNSVGPKEWVDILWNWTRRKCIQSKRNVLRNIPQRYFIRWRPWIVCKRQTVFEGISYCRLTRGSVGVE